MFDKNQLSKPHVLASIAIVLTVVAAAIGIYEHPKLSVFWIVSMAGCLAVVLFDIWLAVRFTNTLHTQFPQSHSREEKWQLFYKKPVDQSDDFGKALARKRFTHQILRWTIMFAAFLGWIYLIFSGALFSLQIK